MSLGFPYYLGLTDLDTGSVSDLWIEPATVQGNFLANSTGSITKLINNSGEDFTLICTIDKLQSATNSGAIGLLRGSNWNFGIDASNFFFVNCKKESYTFDDINIGKKTCFSLSKNGGVFTVTNFNVPSQEIEKSQTQFFSPGNNPTGTGLAFAGSSGISGIKNFYGIVDQLALFNKPLSSNNLSTLFSGFLRQNIVHIPLPTISELTYVTWDGSTGISQSYLNFLLSGAKYFAEDVRDFSPSAGNYYGQMDLANSPPYQETSFFDPSQTTNFCPTFNIEEIGTHTMGNITGLPSLIQSNIFLNYNEISDTYFSFDFSQIQPGLSLNLTYTIQGGEDTFIIQNPSYYSGFYMYGIVSPKARATMLGNFPTGFQYINNLGIFDVISGDYLAPGAISNDRLFVDGEPETNYSVNGNHVSILNLVETEENQLIYDQVSGSGLTLQFFNTHNFSTGKFFPKTAAVFTGDQSFLGMWRILEPNFLETHPYHLYHGKEIPIPATGLTYNNLENNWQ